MKKELVKISANEMNRYMYCSYQWYYKRTYGPGELQKRYKALGIESSNHENHYVKGLKHHSRYHHAYQAKRIIQGMIAILTLALIVGVMLR